MRPQSRPPGGTAAQATGHDPKLSVVDAVINWVTDEIAAGHFRPGDRLPTEPELASRLGVGRNSLREAVKILEAMGVLSIRRADGTFVASGFSPRLLHPLFYGMLLGAGEMRHMMDMRRLVEAGCLRAAAERRSGGEVKELEAALASLTAAVGGGEVDAITGADIAFHRCIAGLGGNPLYGQVQEMLDRLTFAARQRAVRRHLNIDGCRAMLARHAAMYQVVAEQDGQAAGFIGEVLFSLLDSVG